MPKAFFRCDAGPGIGNGHIFRSLAIAAELADRGWNCVFAGNEFVSDIIAKANLHTDKIGSVHLKDTQDPSCFGHALSDGCDLIVFDHYKIDADYETSVRGLAQKLLVIDDLANRPHMCDYLVDQGNTRTRQDYADLIPEGCETLFGLDYVMVPVAVQNVRERCLTKSRTDRIQRVLITVGAVDGRRLLPSIIEGVRGLNQDIQMDVVFGQSATTKDDVYAMLGPDINIHIDTPEMARLISAADFGIGAGGVSAFERCCCGLPSLLIRVADNQKETCQTLIDAGAVEYLGDWESVTPQSVRTALEGLFSKPERRREMSDSAADLIDGAGARRIVDAMGV